MLKHLHIKNFTIINELALDWTSGLTVLTGETGAGKSIMIDALEMVLGERADTAFIQAGSERCEITATFSITKKSQAAQWLQREALDEVDECLVRRVINREGPSRNTINGRPCTLQQVRELGAMLVHIHGQNKHSLLLKNSYQQELLDEFAAHTKLCNAVRENYDGWHQVQQQLQSCQQSGQQYDAQKELLTFQIQEFELLGLQVGELNELEQEQQRLANAEQWISSCQQVLNVLSENEPINVTQGLHIALQQLRSFSVKAVGINPAISLLDQAIIQINEATAEVQNYLNSLELDPQRLNFIDTRLAAIHALARKHRITVEELLPHKEKLEQQLWQLANMDERIAQLNQQLEEFATTYKKNAQLLTASRQLAAEQLSKKITKQIQALGMPKGQFQVQLSPYPADSFHPHGAEQVQFLVAMNPGHPMQLMSKVASGGELSRISLAIQVVTAQTNTLPTLIFDEVDTGVGGGVAEMVGQQLRSLGERAQVLCVTHLPQVAAQGHQHFRIQKQIKKNMVETQVQTLSTAERMEEIARMLGGIKITETTLAHAREMLGV